MQCKCGFSNSAGAKFCGSCGLPLAQPAPSDNPVLSADAPALPVPPPAVRPPRRPLSPARIATLVAAAAIVAAGYWWFNRPPGQYTPDNSGLFAIKVDDKYGFMNKSGNTVIAPQFDEVGGFAEGLSAVRVGTKWGYVNTKGAIMITPQFDAARPFRYGRAAVKLCCGSWFSSTTNDRFGFIDEDGKYIHSPDFLWVGYLGFGGDLAPVKTAEGAIAFVNRAGEVMLSGKFSSVTDGGFSEGVAPVESTGKWGYVDTAGEWIINPQFEGAQGFSGGLAPVVVGGKTGYINTAGRFIINPQYSWGGEFVDGSAIITQPAGMGLIDREGRAVVEVGKFEVVGTFQDGLARVKAGDGWGFIDSSGALAIGAEFDSADEFQNGLARVTALGKEGYITTAGIFVVNPFPGATVKQEKARLAEEARQAQADADAARAATEARAVEERTRLIAEAPQQVLGQWRWSDQSTTQYLPNGTVQGLSRDGGTFTNSWVINGEVLTVVPIDVNGRPANREEISFRIVELNQSKFTVTNIRTKEDSSATRVP